MRYANLNNNRVEASKDVIGAVCPVCGSSVFPACGNVNVHHFRHKDKADCDPWYEPMSEWHIKWQNEFPESFREIVLVKDQNIHRADILNSKGTILEFQNSPISEDQIISRENFYENMIWIFNGNNINSLWLRNNNLFTWIGKKHNLFSCSKPVFIDYGRSLYWINRIPLKNLQFKLRKKGHSQYFEHALDEVNFNSWGRNSYYALYPCKQYSKSLFISHYCI